MKLFSAILSTLLLLGTVAVSADETIAENSNPADYVPIVEINLVVEGPDTLYASLTGFVEGNGSVSVGDVIAYFLDSVYPHIEKSGIEDDFITSLDNVENGVFGGNDGWLYIVNWTEFYEDGDETSHMNFIDVPNVGINEYMIEKNCRIVLYYADYGAPIADYRFNDDGFVSLEMLFPVYDDEQNFIGFNEQPMANGSITFYPMESVSDEVFVFYSDENGDTELDSDFRAVPNGVYFCVVDKKSDIPVELNGVIIIRSEVLRCNNIFVIENEPLEILPSEEEIFMEKIFLLLIGIA